jgi:sugar lactone lactonase YvrE
MYQNTADLDHFFMNTYQTIADTRDRVGESPVWDVRGQRLWWVDIESACIRCTVLGQAEAVQSWQMPERVGCIALTAVQGQLIAAMETGIARVTLQEGGQADIDWLAHIQHPAPGMRFNDGRCDASGRLWVGTMVMDMGKGSNLGALYCLDERGLTGPYVAGLYTPNGLGFSPDGRKMYLSDSHPKAQKIWSFNFDASTGTPTDRELFVDMTDMPGRPDGAAVDALGRYWICANDGASVYCFDHKGELVQFLPVPFPKPAMCAFGGEDLSTLYVTSIVPADKSLDTNGLSGCVVSLQPNVQGMPEPRFSRFPTVPLPSTSTSRRPL